MSEGGGEPVATDEQMVVSKPLFGAVVVGDGQGNNRFPDSTCTDESDWRFSARLAISSNSSSRPQQALGSGGGDSSSTLDVNLRCWIPW